MSTPTCKDIRIPQATAGEQPGKDRIPLTKTDSTDGSLDLKRANKRKAPRDLISVWNDLSEVQCDPIDCGAKFEYCGMDCSRGIKNIRGVIARMLINNELRLGCVENERFERFCSILEPRFQVPSRIIAGRDCLNLYVEEKNKLKDVLVESTQSVCLSVKTWTSKQKLNYMRFTAHYIDSDWKLQKRILKFCQVPNHKVETISKNVEKSLLEWDIKRIFTVAVNNASSSDGVVAYLSNKVTPILKGEFMQMRYFSNILHLTFEEGLKYFHDSISRIRDVVRYVKTSPTRLWKFKASVEQEKISSNKLVCLDVPNDWDPTYLMLKVAVNFEKAFERLEKEDSHYFNGFVNGERTPSHVDWDIARTCVNHLKIFYDASLEFSKSFHVTSNLFLVHLAEIHDILQCWGDSKDLHLKNMADNIRQKCQKYWGNLNNVNPLLFVAVLLDPRYKEKGLKLILLSICDDDLLADELTKKARKTLDSLYENYSMLYPTSHKRNDTEVGNGQLTALAQYLKKMKKRDEERELKTAVDRYLAESLEDSDDDNFDILDWWKVRTYNCKILLMIVRDVLAIPISIATSESDFYTSGMILNSSRSSLPSETMEAFICAQNWSCPLA